VRGMSAPALPARRPPAWVLLRRGAAAWFWSSTVPLEQIGHSATNRLWRQKVGTNGGE
jgi:hypothetical protein